LSPAPARSALSAAGLFTWTFPGAPIQIQLAFDLISRLKADICQPESDDAPKIEIGGILLGKKHSPFTIEIVDYVLAFRGQHSEVHYKVNLAVLEMLRQDQSGLSVLGYFRTQSESFLRLRDEEVEFFGKHFPDPSNVVLLIQTSCEPNNAGILCWGDGVFLPYSFMEFPFDSELLRREVEANLIDKAPALPAAIGRELQTIPPTTTLDRQTKDRQTEDRQTKPHFPGRPMLAAGAVILALAGLTAFISRDRWLPSRAPSVVPQVSSSALPLEVEPQGTGLNLRWNPQSIPAGKATGGILDIREGDHAPRLITLNPEQLAAGHIYYQSSAPRIEFRLEVSGDAGPIAKGAVLALLSNPEAAPSTPAPRVRPADPTPVRKVQSISIPTEPTKSASAADKPAPRRFFVPQPQQKGAEPAKPIVDVPAPEPPGSAIAHAPPLPETSGGLSGLRLPAFNPPPTRAANPVPAETSPAPPKPTPAAPAVATQPVPARKVQPILRPAISALIPANTDVVITIRAQIDATGRVVKADVLRDRAPQSGYYAQLELAAIDATRQWKFEPARSGNTAVPGDYAITFHFQKH
jgi:protein TonB